MSSTQMKELLKTALQIARLSKRIIPERTPKDWNQKSWAELADTVSSSTHYIASTSLPGTCKQISTLVGGSATESTPGDKPTVKRKVDAAAEGDSIIQSSAKRSKTRKKATNEAI